MSYTKKLFLAFFFLLTAIGFAQNIGINSTGAIPNAAALLDVDAAPGNNKGILIPRVGLTITTSNAPIGAGVVTSLMVYNNATLNDVTPGYYYWDGTKWVRILGSDNAWLLLGNAGTTAGTNFLGTTDAQDLVFKTNSTEWMRVTSTGHVGVGTSTPSVDGALHVNSTAANSTKWSTSNYGANIIVGGPGGGRNPAIAFLDFSGANPFAIANAGNLVITRMPALGNGAIQQSYDMNIFASDGHTELGVLAGGNPAFYRDLIVSGKTGLFTIPINTLDVNGGTAMGSYAGVNTAPVNGAIISGNVGIALTNPQAALSVAGNAPLDGMPTVAVFTGVVNPANRVAISVTEVGGNHGGYGQIASMQSGVLPRPLVLQGVGTGWDGVDIWNCTGDIHNALNVGAIGNGTSGYNGGVTIGSTFINSIAPVSGLLVEGNVGIGTTSPAAKLEVDGEIRFVNGQGSTLWSNVAQRDFDVIQSNTSPNRAFTVHSGSNSGSSFFNIAVDFYGNDGLGNNLPGFTMLKNCNVGIGTTAPTQALHVIGNICYTGGIGACSDVRYKKDFNPLTNSLANVLKISGLTYYWKTEEFPEQKFTKDKQIGFVAQELEKIYPELVTTDKNGYKSVDYSRLTPILVEAMKEQQKKIEELEAQVKNSATQTDDLKVEITNLKTQYGSRLQALEDLLLNASVKK